MTIRPTKRAAGLVIGALALFAVGTNVQAGWVLAVAALLGGIVVVGAVVPIVALKGLSVGRSAPRTAQAGDPLPVTVTIANVGRSLRGLVRAEDRFCGTGSAVASVLRAGESRTFRDHRTEARRGVWSSGSCVLESGAPFGVVLARRTMKVESPIVVHPRVFRLSLTELWGRSATARAVEGDVSSVREFRPGDPLRHVHWRSSARRGELVVREFDDVARTGLLVAPLMPLDAEAADAVASVACSIALSAMREGREVHLTNPDVNTHAHAAGEILDWGARLTAEGHSLEDMLSALRGSRAIVTVFLADADAPTIASRLAGLASGGTSVLAIVVDDRAPGAPASDAASATLRALRGSGAMAKIVPTTGLEACFEASALAC